MDIDAKIFLRTDLNATEIKESETTKSLLEMVEDREEAIWTVDVEVEGIPQKQCFQS